MPAKAGIHELTYSGITLFVIPKSKLVDARPKIALGGHDGLDIYA